MESEPKEQAITFGGLAGFLNEYDSRKVVELSEQVRAALALLRLLTHKEPLAARQLAQIALETSISIERMTELHPALFTFAENYSCWPVVASPHPQSLSHIQRLLDKLRVGKGSAASLNFPKPGQKRPWDIHSNAGNLVFRVFARLAGIRSEPWRSIFRSLLDFENLPLSEKEELLRIILSTGATGVDDFLSEALDLDLSPYTRATNAGKMLSLTLGLAPISSATWKSWAEAGWELIKFNCPGARPERCEYFKDPHTRICTPREERNQANPEHDANPKAPPSITVKSPGIAHSDIRKAFFAAVKVRFCRP